MNLKKVMAVAMCAVTAACFTACGKDDDADVILPIYDEQVPNYATTEAYIGTISESLRVKGNFDTPYSVNAAFTAVSGNLDEILVKAETTIEKGDPIAVLRDDNLEDRITEQALKLNSVLNTYNTLVENDGDEYEIQYAYIDYSVEKIKYDSLVEQRDNLTLYAPISGKITWVADYQTGDYIDSGRSICTINDTSKVYVVCSSEYIGAKEFGTQVNIKQGVYVDCYGTVIDMVSNQWRGADRIVISVPDDVEFLDFGDLECHFTVSKHDDVVIVPSDAIKTINERNFVNVLMNGMKVEIDVEVGLSSGNETEIISGLSGGEQIILN